MALPRHSLRALFDSPYRTFQLFAVGALMFFAGLGAIYVIDRELAPGTQTELLAIGALLLLGAGFTLAVGAQLLFILQRLKK